MTEGADLTTARAVKDDDDYAPWQKWSLISNQSDIFEWKNDSFSDYEMQLMMQNDAFAQTTGYRLSNLTGDMFNLHYDYWIQSRFEFTSGVDGYNVNDNISKIAH